MPLLEVERLSLSFGGVAALRDVEWQVEQGSVSALIGPNGAGKTTLFNCVTGFLAPSRGAHVRYDGVDVTRWPTHRLARRGLVRTFQHPKGFGARSLRDNLVATLRVARRRDSEVDREADRLLDELGLSAHAGHDIASSRYGVVRRLSIALAVALEPRLLMLDEPAAGLSDQETTLLANIINRLRVEGRTVVLVEHNMRFLMSIADHITVLDAGGVIANGTPSEIARDKTVISVYIGETALA